jgi:hypothetical protein
MAAMGQSCAFVDHRAIGSLAPIPAIGEPVIELRLDPKLPFARETSAASDPNN